MLLQQAAKALKITPEYLLSMGGVDEIVPEPLGGAHSDPMAAFPAVKEAIVRWFKHYKDMPEIDIMKDRYLRYRKFGLFDDYLVDGGEKEQAAERRRKVSSKCVPVTSTGYPACWDSARSIFILHYEL